MKVTYTTKSEKPSVTYPCIRVSVKPTSKGLIVMFLSPDSGVVLDPGEQEFYAFGQTQDGWVNSEDKDYWAPGSVTLSSLED